MVNPVTHARQAGSFGVTRCSGEEMSRHLLAVDQASSGATCLLPASVDRTQNPEEPS